MVLKISLLLPATHRVGAELVRTGYDIEVQVVDVAESEERGLIKLSDCTLEEGLIQSFSDSLAVLPGLQQLLSQVTERVASNGAQRTTYYSADEGGPVEISGGKAKASTKAKAERAKKQPAAQAAAEILPTMAAQLASLWEAQERIQVELQIRTERPLPRASQMPATISPQEFALAMGSPPKTENMKLSPPPPPAKAAHALDSHMSLQEQLEEANQEEEEANPLTRAMLEQSRALTALVSHIQQGDPLMDMPGTSSSTSFPRRSRQRKDATGTCPQVGKFFLTVLQNMHRRLKPAMPLPSNLDQLAQTDLSMVQYLERFGGYGNVRDMGIVHWPSVWTWPSEETWKGSRSTWVF